MFTGLGGKVAQSCDLDIFVGMYVHVCSGKKAGIVGEYSGSDSLVVVKRGPCSSLGFFAGGCVVSSSRCIRPCDACRTGSVLVEQSLQLDALEHVLEDIKSESPWSKPSSICLKGDLIWSKKIFGKLSCSVWSSVFPVCLLFAI